MTIDANTRRAPTPPSPSSHAIATALTAAFLTACLLKLAGVVTWPWSIILAPIWLPWACAFVFVVAALTLAVRK
jgi:hypothetical protein